MEKNRARAIPLLRGVEGCVIRHIEQHTPATTHPNAPPLERGVAVIEKIFSGHVQFTPSHLIWRYNSNIQ
jgi:hypothetical protein